MLYDFTNTSCCIWPLILISSSNGRQAIFGLENGSIRIQSLENEFDLSSLGPYWMMSFHDNNYGYITNLRTSFDDHMMLSAGGDGNFFLYNIMDQEKLDQKVAEAKAKIPSAKVCIKYCLPRYKVHCVDQITLNLWSQFLSKFLNGYTSFFVAPGKQSTT